MLNSTIQNFEKQTMVWIWRIVTFAQNYFLVLIHLMVPEKMHIIIRQTTMDALNAHFK